MTMTISRAVIIVVLGIAISGEFYFLTKKDQVKPSLLSDVSTLPDTFPQSPNANTFTNTEPTPSVQVGSQTEIDTTVNSSSDKDEYGFFKKFDLTGLYPEAKPLYSENGFTYRVYTRDTEGAMPVVKEGTSTKEYVGLAISRKDILSPDKHHFVFAPYSGNKICVAQISPKMVTCLTPTVATESFVRISGDYEEAVPKIAWVTNHSFQYAVYAKEPSSTRGADENAQPIRMETYSF